MLTKGGGQGQDQSSDVAMVEQAIRQWFDLGIAVGNVEVIRRALTSTATILEGVVWYDVDNFVNAAKTTGSAHSGAKLRYHLSDWRTRVRGRVAWTTFRNRAEFTLHGATIAERAWCETVILINVDNAWLIDRYHSAPL